MTLPRERTRAPGRHVAAGTAAAAAEPQGTLARAGIAFGGLAGGSGDQLVEEVEKEELIKAFPTDSKERERDRRNARQARWRRRI